MNRFRKRLLFWLILLILIVFISLGILVGQLFKNFYTDSFNLRLKMDTSHLAEKIENGGGINKLDKKQLEFSSDLLSVRITVFNKNGDKLFDSGSARDREIRTFFNSIKSQDFLGQHVQGASDETQYYWESVKSPGNSLDGIVIVSTKLTQLKEVYGQIWLILALSLGFALAVIILLGTWIMTSYTKPIESATNVAIELSKGNYRARTFERQMNETGMLSSAINKLARNLQEMDMSQEMQKDRLSTLIENMGSGLILIDSRGYITMSNKIYQDLFSLDSDDFMFKPYYEVIKFKEIVRLVEEIFITEMNVRRQLVLSLNIERKHFEIYGAPIIGNHDEWNGILLVFHDITDLKKLEQMRKDFVANVSHELKTPITSIKGFSETLLDGAMNDQDTLKSFLTIILNESDRLQTLIKDLLDLSKIEQQGFKLNLQLFDLTNMMEEVMAILSSKAEDKKVSLSFSSDKNIEMEGDHFRLKQVFINLINNAIMYTPPEGSIHVGISDLGSKLKVEIADTGIGIEQEEIPRIFERFYRVDKARSRNSGGTGLGLAIVKHLIEAHKGYISVKSKKNEGTVFSVILYKEFPENKNS
ncbi:two-component system histidine kinase PnpS [Falsibacillus pallidus]|uniref:histidine kinase n=1 Tax=Falsibacillus pallidus TaxID=493781 RepID=A0A370GKD5_9BACI|nr:ATP-binding protein [Falsibacillus pallidus]RDI44242.1 two-component system phosphate regulon sensor histidine kinase PhoR [Falsibacillus pallidus]